MTARDNGRDRLDNACDIIRKAKERFDHRLIIEDASFSFADTTPCGPWADFRP